MEGFRTLIALGMTIFFAVTFLVPAAESQENPPSAYCVKLGGKSVTEKRPDGVEIDVCRFEGDLQCEAWALYRLQCPPGGVKVDGGMSPGARYCVIRGGKYSATGGKGQCTFDTGQICSIEGYFNGRCE